MLSFTLDSPWLCRSDYEPLYALVRFIASMYESYLFLDERFLFEEIRRKEQSTLTAAVHRFHAFYIFSFATSSPIFPSACLLDRRNQANKLPSIYHEAAVHAHMRKLLFLLFHRGAGCTSVYFPRGTSSAQVPGCPSVDAKCNIISEYYYFICINRNHRLQGM